MPPSLSADGIRSFRNASRLPSGTSVPLGRNPPTPLAGTIQASVSVQIGCVRDLGCLNGGPIDRTDTSTEVRLRVHGPNVRTADDPTGASDTPVQRLGRFSST